MPPLWGFNVRDDVIFSQSGHDCPVILCPVIRNPHCISIEKNFRNVLPLILSSLSIWSSKKVLFLALESKWRLLFWSGKNFDLVSNPAKFVSEPEFSDFAGPGYFLTRRTRKSGFIGSLYFCKSENSSFLWGDCSSGSGLCFWGSSAIRTFFDFAFWSTLLFFRNRGCGSSYGL